MTIQKLSRRDMLKLGAGGLGLGLVGGVGPVPPVLAQATRAAAENGSLTAPRRLTWLRPVKGSWTEARRFRRAGKCKERTGMSLNIS